MKWPISVNLSPAMRSPNPGLATPIAQGCDLQEFLQCQRPPGELLLVTPLVSCRRTTELWPGWSTLLLLVTPLVSWTRTTELWPGWSTLLLLVTPLVNCKGTSELWPPLAVSVCKVPSHSLPLHYIYQP